MPLRPAVAMLCLLLALPLRAQDAASAFRAIIQSQIDAFLADDVDRAFGYAAPGIQQVFRTPENFGEMVRNGYPMVWRPAGVEFLDLHPKNGRLWQRVRIHDAAGRVHVLDYEMVATPDGLRIGAVEILAQPGVGA
jgi:Domain of unknown function (DUF4864)